MRELKGMSNRDAALTFLECFCAGNIDGLEVFLSERLQVRGPLHQFSSRAEYLESLRADPPQACGYAVLSVATGDDEVTIFYDYLKTEGALTVAQLFRFDDHRIAHMRLVFDTDGFEQP